jgi:DNA-directed RNA polymerase subunit beta'
VIAAQSIGEPGTQLSLDSKHRSGVVADDTAQGLSPRRRTCLKCEHQRDKPTLSEIAGEVHTSEEADHYIVQVTAKSDEKITLDLDGRSAHVRSGSDAALGDVIAAREDGADPLIATNPRHSPCH